VLLICGSVLTSSAEAKKLNVITATTDLAALAQEVGGDKIDVESIAKGYQDPHFVEAKPSFLLKLRHADLLVVVGLDLEIGWLPPLITQSGNGRIQPGGQGYLEASQFAEILEIPQGRVDRSQGDVHPQGNPHYWLDPDNGRRIAKGIAGRLSELDPGDSAYFQQRLQDFTQRLAAAEKRWDADMAPYHGRKIVTYKDAHAGNFDLRNLSSLDLKLLPGLLRMSTTLDPQFLEPYYYGAFILPDLNPDEFVWGHAKSNGVSKKPLRKNESLKERVETDLEAIKQNKKLVRSFFCANSVAYARD